MNKFLLALLMLSTSLSCAEVLNTKTSTSLIRNGEALWTYNHDPVKGKPYFHPLASTDGTMFTDLPTTDHPWHRGLWFSWKFINGVNYWEEKGYTGIPREGYTRLLSTKREFSMSNAVRIEQTLDYAPSKEADAVLTEERVVQVSAPDAQGVYTIDWFCQFTALEQDVRLDRTPLPHEPNGKPHGGYAGLSVRMNKQVLDGTFVNQNGEEGEQGRRKASPWVIFKSPQGGSLLFLDHSDNLNAPAKWFISVKAPYFSPAVIHDGAHTIPAGESLTLKYRIILTPTTLTQDAAEQFWQEWK